MFCFAISQLYSFQTHTATLGADGQASLNEDVQIQYIWCLYHVGDTDYKEDFVLTESDPEIAQRSWVGAVKELESLSLFVPTRNI